jgi:putative nucleotidyltransferase with HDIG domain
MNHLDVIRKLKNSGHEAYLVGGCVRDKLLGLEPKDFDIATSALPDQVEALFPKTIAVGKSFGVIVVLTDTEAYEVTTFRSDSPGRKPTVRLGSIIEDAQRRDFTINAIYHDPIDNVTVDPVNGRKDLDTMTLRTIGKAEDRFNEDPLRLIRAIRFSARFKMDDSLMQTIFNNAHLIDTVSPERIKMEMDKILMGFNPIAPLTRLHLSGIMKRILPEVEALFHTPQDQIWHPEGDAGIHTLLAVQEAFFLKAPLLVLWACLFHDLGKAVCSVTTPEGRITAYGHDAEGAEIARQVLIRLKFSNKEINHISYLVKNHMVIGQARRFKKKTLMRFYYDGNDVGLRTFEDLVMLFECDCKATGLKTSMDNLLFLKNVHLTIPALKPVPLVNGADLIILGYKPGPEFKSILDNLYTAQLEDTSLNKEDLLRRLSCQQ